MGMKIVVVFNMRGGIAKTTTAVTLAESLLQFGGLNILLVDADPQRNASARLCDLQLIEECGQARLGKNISKYLSDAVIKNYRPDPGKYITQSVGTIKGIGALDILMGSQDNLDADRHFAGKCTTDGDRVVFSKLGAAFESLGDNGSSYDVMIIGSPPALTTLVQGALCVADLLLVPMVAQSTSQLLYGSTEKQIARHLKSIGCNVPETLVIATMFEASNQTFFDRIKEYFGSDLRIKKRKAFMEKELFSPEDGVTIKEKYGAAEPELKMLATKVGQRLGLRFKAKSGRVKQKEGRNVRQGRGDRSGVPAGTN